MTAPNCLYLTVLAFAAIIGWATSAHADDDVTVIAPTTTTTPPAQKTADSDGTPVIHKSLHKKKPAETDTASGTASQGTPSSATTPVASAPASTPHPPPPPHAPINPIAMVQSPVIVPPMGRAPAPLPPQSYVIPLTTYSKSLVPSNPSPALNTPLTSSSPALVPAVETGLPVARYPGMGTPIKGVSTYLPTTVMIPGKSFTGTTTHQPLYASVLPTSVAPLTSAGAGLYSTYSTPPSRTTTQPADFVFTNYSKKPRVTYPWKTNIITTIFWIGEGSTPISSTTNVQSSWDEDWLQNNHGTDSPFNRNGYASGSHASTLNPFYIALPFNDLAFPDKASEWVPRSWHRPREDGKEVSACKDRWVCIKNAQGRTCYAQWEDVGPLRYDHAEYVFGDERPIGLGDDHAGLDVSPAVAQYLGIDGKNRITSWRFVDDLDVRPGPWLLLDEQAVIFTALHQMKNSSLPIQKASEPIDDQDIDANKKKVDQSKG